jgi:hypothetical protein
MDHDEKFAEDIARELDAVIRMLDARQSLIESLMGTEHVEELSEYLKENIEHSQEQDIAELDRWLDSRDNEWIYVVKRLRHVREQRVMLGRLCMTINVNDRQAD